MFNYYACQLFTLMKKIKEITFILEIFLNIVLQKFLTNEIGQSLWLLYRHSSVESLKVTALSVCIFSMAI